MAEFILLAGLVALAIVFATQVGKLRASIEKLRIRVNELENRIAKPSESVAEPKRIVPPPLPAFLQPPPETKPAESGIGVQPTNRGEDHRQVAEAASLNWESIFGVKLFAWVGGLALFLGTVFFVKYAFENNLITPALRIVAGAVIGMALIIIGTLPGLRRFRVPAQSLCATGVLILYASTYAAHSFYDLIPLSAATALMWVITGVALALAAHADAQSIAVLGILGGFLTPALLWSDRNDPVSLFGYIAVLNFAVAAVSALKRWNYLILMAAIGSVVAEFVWAPWHTTDARNIFLAMEAQFLVIGTALRSAKRGDGWSIAGAALTGFAVLGFCILSEDFGRINRWDFVFPILLLSNAGLIGLAVAYRTEIERAKIFAAIVAVALAGTWLAEWSWHLRVFSGDQPLMAIIWFVAIFLLFAAAPYFCGIDRVWPWMIAAAAGPLQFWFVYQLTVARFSVDWIGLLPIAFALPAATGLVYLVQRQHVDLESGDSRLASQGAAVLTFVSLVFPVQFHREWITLGWAIEGLALILLFRLIPNRRLRAAALIVLSAAFVRLVFNPAVFDYHPRTHTPILNWYLYAYGLAALCFVLSAHWFGDPLERRYERHSSPILYSFAGIVSFLLMNIEIADYFSIGPTLIFSFEGNFARDMTYTIGWAAFALVLLLIGLTRNIRAVRIAAIALLTIALAKLFLHDLDALDQLYRIGAFFAVAIIAIVAAFAYQRFLSPKPRVP